jgi:hypothetical protein
MSERSRAADDFDVIRSRLAEIGKRPWHDEAPAAPGSASIDPYTGKPFAPNYQKFSSRSAVNKDGKTVWCTAIEKFNNAPRCHNGAPCCRNAPSADDPA